MRVITNPFPIFLGLSLILVSTAYSAPRPRLTKLQQEAYIGAGFKAKTLCSGIFVSGRDEREVDRADFQGEGLALRLIQAKVDYLGKCVTTSSLPVSLNKRTACYTEDFGCRLIDMGVSPIPPNVLSGIDRSSAYEVPVSIPYNPYLEQVVDYAFRTPFLNTRSIIVLHKDKVVAERYAEGFGINTRMHGWSMSKSITNAMLGVLSNEGRFSFDSKRLFPQWRQRPYDLISLQSLLEMSSGLKFDEDYGNPLSDVNQMLFGEVDMGNFALQKPLEALPGEKWQYSSGTSNILQLAMRRSFPTHAEYLRFPYEKLFKRANMKSTVFEVDPSGTFVGSSNVYATTRDWSRFGLLLLHNGKLDNDQILPADWVAKSSIAAPKSPQGKYGKHFWTNRGTNIYGSDRPWPLLPTDAYAALGYDGQNVLVIPSKELVIVRFGHTKPETLWDINAFASAVISAL